MHAIKIRHGYMDASAITNSPFESLQLLGRDTRRVHQREEDQHLSPKLRLMTAILALLASAEKPDEQQCQHARLLALRPSCS